MGVALASAEMLVADAEGMSGRMAEANSRG
jgi:hypothetical protein